MKPESNKVGTDIVEVSRISQLANEHGERFYRHVYTQAEVRWCQDRAVPAMHLAGRFAAKEAVNKTAFKNFSTGSLVLELDEILLYA